MTLDEPSPGAAPRLVRKSGNGPEDLEEALRAAVACFDEAGRGGASLPGRITVAWDDTAVGLRLEDYRAFRAGQLDLADLAARSEVGSGADPGLERAAAARPEPVAAQAAPQTGATAPAGPLPGPLWAWLGGLGCGGLLLAALGLALALRRRGAGAAAVPRRAPQPHRAPPGPPPLPPAAGPPPLPAAAPAWLHIQGGPLAGRRVPLAARLRVGRETQGNDLVLEDPSISRHHAELRAADGGFQVLDLGSSNGTWLNGSRLQGPAPLRSGDLLQFGNLPLRVE